MRGNRIIRAPPIVRQCACLMLAGINDKPRGNSQRNGSIEVQKCRSAATSGIYSGRISVSPRIYIEPLCVQCAYVIGRRGEACAVRMGKPAGVDFWLRTLNIGDTFFGILIIFNWKLLIYSLWYWKLMPCMALFCSIEFTNWMNHLKESIECPRFKFFIFFFNMELLFYLFFVCLLK